MNDINPVINLDHLHFHYEAGRPILRDIHCTIMENEFIAIIGQNGSGKTTLLKNISGLLRPCAGRIVLRGADTAGMSVAQIAGEAGFVMQDPDHQLFESTVYNEITFALKHMSPPREIQRRAEEALAALGLADKRESFPPALDRADRVKVIFAAVLAMGSKIIMLDEPLAGQDRRGCRLLMDILSGLHQRGYTIIIVTHNIPIAAEYARRIIVMKHGSLFLDGNPLDVFTQTETLAGAGILPPPVTRLSQSLRNHITLEKDALTPAELAGLLLTGK